MKRNPDSDRTDADLEERLRASFQAARMPTTPPTIRDRALEIVATEPSVLRRSAPSRGVAAALGLAAVAVVVGLIGTDVISRGSPSPAATESPTESSAPTSTVVAPPLGHYAGEGWGFDHPSTWTFSPFPFTASFFDIVGYLGSSPVDTTTICTGSTGAVSCNFDDYRIRPGNVVIEVAAWSPPPLVDPDQMYDHPDEGLRVTVGGMPAVFSEERVAADHVRFTWKIARPASFSWIQLDVEILGPGSDELRRQVEALIASFAFVPAPVPLAEGPDAANAVATHALATLRASEPAAYECFPSESGTTKEITTSALPSATLKKPLPVRCSTTIRRTEIGLWRLELAASWDSAPDRKAGTSIQVQWLTADGTIARSSGSGDSIPYCCE